MLDLFCGRLGWSKAFLARGWECVGVDLVEPQGIPEGCVFVKADILGVRYCRSMDVPQWEIYGAESPRKVKGYGVIGNFDFICASSPCEQFSVHGMKHFHPNPPYPELGIKLFEHTRAICEASGVPYVMENVRAAQQFVGDAVHHCGPFYLWGTGVPALMNQGVTKGMAKMMGILRKSDPAFHGSAEAKRLRRKELGRGTYGLDRAYRASKTATIPPELANCVCDYAERICEGKS